jgi:PiT family inorganic phosphate transporter
MLISLEPAVLLASMFVAVTLVAGNNLSACVGPAIGSRIISKRSGMLIGIAGFTAGLIFQGTEMTKSVSILLPNATAELRISALLVAILIFVIAEIARIPMSLSMSLVGLLAGLSFTSGSLSNTLYTLKVAILWVLAPIAAILAGLYLVRALNYKQPRNIWHRLQAFKLLLIFFSFTTAFVLGANTLGLVVATAGFDLITISTAIIGIIIGVAFLSSGPIKRISQEFYLMRYTDAFATMITDTVLVELATLFNIPLSNTQTAASAAFGTGISYRSKFVSLRPFLIIVAGWIVAPIISFLLGMLVRVVIV